MKEKKILAMCGRPGHFQLMIEMRKYFQMEVVPLFSDEKIKAYYYKYYKNKFKEYYSIPEHYNEISVNSDKEFIEKKLEELTKKFNITEINKYIHFDRNLREVESFEQLNMYQYSVLKLLEEIFEAENIYFIKGGAATFLGNVLFDIAEYYNIEIINLRKIGFGNRPTLFTKRGHIVDFQKEYKKIFENYNDIEKLDRNNALDYIDNFRKNPKRPAYTEANSQFNFGLKKFINKLGIILGEKIKTNEFQRALLRKGFDYKFKYLSFPGVNFVKEFIFTRIKFKIQKKYLESTSNKAAFHNNNKYIYLPLQFVPEITTLTYGLFYENQENFIKILSASVPAGYKIYIKDHTSMIGRRKNSFYKTIKKLYNVEMVPANTDTFTLMQNSSGVATVTTNAGTEAFLFGKPVIVFGDAYYNEFPNVLYAKIDNDLSKNILEYLSTFKIDEKVIKTAIVSIFNLSTNCKMGDIHYDTPIDEVEENAICLCKMMDKYINA